MCIGGRTPDGHIYDKSEKDVASAANGQFQPIIDGSLNTNAQGIRAPIVAPTKSRAEWKTEGIVALKRSTYSDH